MKKSYSKQTIAILEEIKSIPYGKVDTYGNIAARSGYPNSARQVSRILHALSSKEKLPWHRVVGQKGRIALKGQAKEEQILLLRSEGVDCSRKMGTFVIPDTSMRI
jgi:methylated-DNA-protein-cysteine methyltransferase related protein